MGHTVESLSLQKILCYEIVINDIVWLFTPVTVYNKFNISGVRANMVWWLKILAGKQSAAPELAAAHSWFSCRTDPICCFSPPENILGQKKSYSVLGCGRPGRQLKEGFWWDAVSSNVSPKIIMSVSGSGKRVYSSEFVLCLTVRTLLLWEWR